MPASALIRHDGISSSWLAPARDVTVYVPAGHPAAGASDAPAPGRAAWPCLILHDGQNLFDPARAYAGRHWQVAETADALIEAGAIPPIVIAGVDHAGEDRIREYTPTPGREPGAGLAEHHTRFLTTELLPFLRETYQLSTQAGDIGLGGSSLGGLVTTFTASASPDVFGRLLIMSPSVWWDRRVILRHAAMHPLARGTRVWLDVGAQEGRRTVADARKLRDVLAGQSGVTVRYVEEAEGDHSEASWARRLGDALTFLFSPAR